MGPARSGSPERSLEIGMDDLQTWRIGAPKLYCARVMPKVRPRIKQSGGVFKNHPAEGNLDYGIRRLGGRRCAGADFLADGGSHPGPEKLDGTHDPVMRHRPDAHLHQKALMAEKLVL